MHGIVRISEFNKRKLHLRRERPMNGGGLMEVLTTLHKLYKVAVPAVKIANTVYRAPLVQKHIIPKSVKKHINPISNGLSHISETASAIGSAHKFLTGGGREDSHLITMDDVAAVKKVEENPAKDLLKLVAKKAKSMKKTSIGAGLYPVGQKHNDDARGISHCHMTGGGLTSDILKKIISVIAIEMISVIVKQVNIKMKLSPDKSAALEKFLTSKLTELLKADLPSLPEALMSVGKFVMSPLKHMFGGGSDEYKQSKNKIMKHINRRAVELVHSAKRR
jgi:hypothetical protein